MFKKYNPSEAVVSSNIAGSTSLKSIREQLIKSYPRLTEIVEIFLHKKSKAKLIKCSNHVEIIVGENGEHLFFRVRDKIYPTLRTLHKYPFSLPEMRVDVGAVSFILGAANVMCPGLTSDGGGLSDVMAGEVVSITVDGKENAIAIGRTKMKSRDVIDVNKGIAIELVHFLGDGLWNSKF